MGKAKVSKMPVKEDNGDKAAQLKEQVEQDKRDRRKKFIDGLQDLMKQHRCRVIGVPTYQPTPSGWLTIIDVDVVAEP